MSSGRLSHLLRGVWLLCLWQGELLNVHLASHRKSEGVFFFFLLGGFGANLIH